MPPQSVTTVGRDCATTLRRVNLERIEITPFAVIAGEILQNRKTGYLTILKAPIRKVLYWSQGELVMAGSESPDDSLSTFLVRRGALPADRAAQIFGDDRNDVVAHLHESGLLSLSMRQTLLREWLTAQFLPLFSLDEGTAAFTDDEPLPPDKRVFLQSTAALLVEGIRSITNGLVLRRSLGDLKRVIEPGHATRFPLESLPLTEQEREIAASLTEPVSIEAFLKRFAAQSVVVAKVVIGLLALGTFALVEERPAPPTDFADMQRDLELLAVIGSNDPRSLRAVGMSRQLANLNHYQILDVARAATRVQIIAAAEFTRKQYDPATYPPIVRDSLNAILRRIDEAFETLKDPSKRAAYDKLLQGRQGEGATSLQQRLNQRSIAEQNFNKARELVADADYYGAIVLLKQAVQFAPDFSEAWQLLGSCQERNPHWRRDAAESYQRALSVDPENAEALISLGDLYKTEGLISRAQTCYEDALKIDSDNQQATSRLNGLKKR
jgi:tetratricopeptide (TPR) repeat protein